MQENSDDIVIFLLVVSALILAMVAFIIIIVYMYRKKQILFMQSLEQMRSDHERTLIETQLEMQEATFQHISREIHDNINLSLTLAKLQLNTFNWNDRSRSQEKLNKSIELLGQSISDLSNISKGLNSDIIAQQGLIEALEAEVQHIRQAGLFNIETIITGNPVYMDAKKDLVIFRTIQEALNNIIKHANARHAGLSLHYDPAKLYIAVSDDGTGFDLPLAFTKKRAGLKNMETRIKMLRGTMNISSLPEYGTTLSFTIPLE